MSRPSSKMPLMDSDSRGRVYDSKSRLRPLRLSDESAFLAAHRAMADEGFTFAFGYQVGMSWSSYLEQLELCRRDRVLVTCDDGNVGSAAVIRRCGGVLDSLVGSTRDGPAKRRYWID